jgi:8-oxo-dGTP pyrophosphatase MutT (NUDIX family)
MSARWKPSVTVAAIIERDGRFLLVEEETADGVRLNQPAGHLDPGESLIDACAREALEETAFRFTPTALLGVYMSRYASPRDHGEDVTYVRFAFTGTLGERDNGRRLDHGILGTLWLAPEEIAARATEHRSPLVMRCVEDFRRGRRFPLDLIFTHADVLSHASQTSPPLQGIVGGNSRSASVAPPEPGAPASAPVVGRGWGWSSAPAHETHPQPFPLKGKGASSAEEQ